MLFVNLALNMDLTLRQQLFCESFATHVDLPKEKWFKQHPPIEIKVVEPIKVEEDTITYNVDPVIPTAYIVKPPFPVRIQDHAEASAMVPKSYTRTPSHPEQIKVEPSITMVKDLVVDNIDGHVIYFYDEDARIARPDDKDKHRPVVGMRVVSVKIGDHCYHGLCDLGASVSAIPFTLYQEIMNDITPAEIEDIVVMPRTHPSMVVTPGGIQTGPTDQYQSFLRILSSLVRTREQLPGRSPILKLLQAELA